MDPNPLVGARGRWQADVQGYHRLGVADPGPNQQHSAGDVHPGTFGHHLGSRLHPYAGLRVFAPILCRHAERGHVHGLRVLGPGLLLAVYLRPRAQPRQPGGGEAVSAGAGLHQGMDVHGPQPSRPGHRPLHGGGLHRGHSHHRPQLRAPHPRAATPEVLQTFAAEPGAEVPDVNPYSIYLGVFLDVHPDDEGHHHHPGDQPLRFDRLAGSRRVLHRPRADLGGPVRAAQRQLRGAVRVLLPLVPGTVPPLHHQHRARPRPGAALRGARGAPGVRRALFLHHGGDQHGERSARGARQQFDAGGQAPAVLCGASFARTPAEIVPLGLPREG
mmetsp:Transcript_81480/g.195469  ORF Transcript_81480/g.195469 Transcript_81480/m.195469 type:complete len:330 (+) Transcript_81480:200-1189(+)